MKKLEEVYTKNKAIKNLYASEYIWNSIKDDKNSGYLHNKKISILAETIRILVLRQQQILRRQLFLKRYHPEIKQEIQNPSCIHPSAQES